MNNDTVKKKWYMEIAVMLCISALVLAVLIAAAPLFPAAGTGEYRLAVIETSDIHGTLATGEDPDYQYRVAYIADKVNDARKTEDGEDPDRLVLLDGGDIYQGSSLSLLTEGEAMSAVFDEMDYDAVAVGNHEFDWGVEKVIDTDQTMRDYEIDGEKHKNDIPVICSNLYKDGKKVEFADDYVILNKEAADDAGKVKKARIGVLGFAEDYSLSNPEKKFTDLGYSISEDYAETNRLAHELKSEKGCDAVILLSHGNAQKAAEGLGEGTPVDLVLGGHIHKSVSDTTEWGLRYLSPSGSAYTYVNDELVFENDGRGGLRIKEGADDKAQCIKTAEDESKLVNDKKNAEELDRETIELTDEYIDRVRPNLEEEIGYITEDVTKDTIEGSGNRSSTENNFVLNAMRRSTGAEVVFINKSGTRGNMYLNPGSDRRSVTMGDMFTMLPFDDRLYEYDLTYGELLDVLNFGMNGGGFTLFTCMTGIDCYFEDDPATDPNKQYKDTVVTALVKDGELIYHDGRWKEGWKDKKVRVAVIEFSAVAEKTKQGAVNPLYGLNETDSLVANDKIVRDCVIEGLKAEAKENGGHLSVDHETCYKYKAYDGGEEL